MKKPSSCSRFLLLFFVLVSLVFMSFSAGFGSMTIPNPEAYYALDGPGAGDVVTDSSGNGHHGQIQGGAAYEAGLFGQAVHFDGATGFISIPDDPGLQITGSFSLAAWVLIDRYGQNAKIESKRTGYQFWFLGVDEGAPYGGVGVDG